MRILSIETSCDETALAILETSDNNHFRALANNILSQITIHRAFGGVFPALAKREHARALVPLLEETLKDAGLYRSTSRHIIEHPLRPELAEIFSREPELFTAFITRVPEIDPPAIDAIAVTEGPGLEPALWVGINFAKALGMLWKIPVIGVNHMEGHFISALLEKTDNNGRDYRLVHADTPILGLLVSGGHTELILMKQWGRYTLVGETKDDAVGEAFDKVARILGLSYPGGPEIARLARQGTPGVYTLPRPMIRSGDYNFSFSGLKTATRYLLQSLGGLATLSEKQRADIAREFEEACVEVLVDKTVRAAKEFCAQTIILGGGVSANLRLRDTLANAVFRELPGRIFAAPAPSLSTDNALMIGVAGVLKNPRNTTTPETLLARGNLRIG